MAQKIFLLAATFLLESALADIIVQPGYGQPHARFQPHFIQQHHPADLGSGYHLELHPLRPNYHGDIVPLVGFDSPTHHIAQKHLPLRKLGRLMGQPRIMHHALPLIAHHRLRRSSDLSDDSRQQTNDIKVDYVASKPAINQNTPSVVDFQNQNSIKAKGKPVDIRQSKSDHAIVGSNLLGLNPTKMYSGSHQYRADIQQHQESNSEKETSKEQESQYEEAQQNFRDASHVKSPQLYTMVPNNVIAQLEETLKVLSQPGNFRTTQNPVDSTVPDHVASARNFPDPRSLLSKPMHAKETAGNNKKYVKNEDQILGTHRLLNYVPKPYYFAPRYETTPSTMYYSFAPQEIYSYPCTSSNYVLYKQNDMDLSQLDNERPKFVEYYQLQNGLQPNYLPKTQYIVLPQKYYNSNYPYEVYNGI